MTTVYLRVRSSLRIHRAERTAAGLLLTAEADNLDEAGERDEVGADVVAEADPELYCRRCFPDGLREEGEP